MYLFYKFLSQNLLFQRLNVPKNYISHRVNLGLTCFGNPIKLVLCLGVSLVSDIKETAIAFGKKQNSNKKLIAY